MFVKEGRQTMKVLLLSESEVSPLLCMREVIEAVEVAFKEYALGHVQMPSKLYLFYPNGDLRTMPSHLERQEISAVKIVNAHPKNPKDFDLPTVMATIILIDAKRGLPLAIMGGTKITAMRTGAAGGIAAKHLARKDSSIVGLVGAGVQARAQLLGLHSLYQGIQEVRVWDISSVATEGYVEEMQSKLPKMKIVSAKSAKQAVEEADIVVTTTPSRKPLVRSDWIPEGTHINCIGADAPGKQELASAILKRAKIVVDCWDQASHSGEINIPLTEGLITKEDIWAELGDIVAGFKEGRSSEDEVTVFDSTGLAIQDAATAELVYRKALNRKVGRFIEM